MKSDILRVLRLATLSNSSSYAWIRVADLLVGISGVKMLSFIGSSEGTNVEP